MGDLVNRLSIGPLITAQPAVLPMQVQLGFMSGPVGVFAQNGFYAREQSSRTPPCFREHSTMVVLWRPYSNLSSLLQYVIMKTLLASRWSRLILEMSCRSDLGALDGRMHRTMNDLPPSIMLRLLYQNSDVGLAASFPDWFHLAKSCQSSIGMQATGSGAA